MRILAVGGVLLALLLAGAEGSAGSSDTPADCTVAQHCLDDDASFARCLAHALSPIYLVKSPVMGL